MLGEPELYFLYVLGHLGCVGRMVSGFITIGSPWSATTKTLNHVRVETNLCAANEQCICLGCHKTCMPMSQPYWKNVA